MKKNKANILAVNLGFETVTYFGKIINSLTGNLGSETTAIIGPDISKIKNLKEFDYLIVEPVCGNMFNIEMLETIIQGRKDDAKLVVATKFPDFGKTADSFFNAMGIEKIIRLPMPAEKIKEILLA